MSSYVSLSFLNPELLSRINRTSPTCLASGRSEQVLCRVLAALAKSGQEQSTARLPLGAAQHCHLGGQSLWPPSQSP